MNSIEVSHMCTMSSDTDIKKLWNSWQLVLIVITITKDMITKLQNIIICIHKSVSAATIHGTWIVDVYTIEIWSNFYQNLSRFWWNFDQILIKFWSNFWWNFDQNLIDFWSKFCQILIKILSDFDWNRVDFWMFLEIPVRFWNLTGFRVPGCQNPVRFWLF